MILFLSWLYPLNCLTNHWHSTNGIRRGPLLLSPRIHPKCFSQLSLIDKVTSTLYYFTIKILNICQMKKKIKWKFLNGEWCRGRMGPPPLPTRGHQLWSLDRMRNTLNSWQNGKMRCSVGLGDPTTPTLQSGCPGSSKAMSTHLLKRRVQLRGERIHAIQIHFRVGSSSSCSIGSICLLGFCPELLMIKSWTISILFQNDPNDDGGDTCSWI